MSNATDISGDLAKAKAAHRKAMDEIHAKHAVLTSLAPFGEYKAPMVHWYPLWGTVGSLKYECDFVRDGKTPDMPLLTSLLERFPPVPAVLVEDGCKSFRPVGQWLGTSTPVCPVHVNVDTYTSLVAEVRWHGHVNERLWRFLVRFPLHQCRWLGNLELDLQRQHGVVTRVRRNKFIPNDPRAKAISWASGSHETPGPHTVYWPADVEPLDIFPAEVTE